MHDRGAAFWSWRGISKFTALLTELGVDQIVAEKKEHNGKVENFNGNLHKEPTFRGIEGEFSLRRRASGPSTRRYSASDRRTGHRPVRRAPSRNRPHDPHAHRHWCAENSAA